MAAGLGFGASARRPGGRLAPVGHSPALEESRRFLIGRGGVKQRRRGLTSNPSPRAAMEAGLRIVRHLPQ